MIFEKNSKLNYVCIQACDMSDDIKDLKKYYKIISTENLDAMFGSRRVAASIVGLFDAFFFGVGVEGPAISICHFKSTTDHTVGSEGSRGPDVSSFAYPRDPIRLVIAERYFIGPVDGICQWNSRIEFLLHIGTLQWCGAAVDAVSLSRSFEKCKAWLADLLECGLVSSLDCVGRPTNQKWPALGVWGRFIIRKRSLSGGFPDALSIGEWVASGKDAQPMGSVGVVLPCGRASRHRNIDA